MLILSKNLEDRLFDYMDSFQAIKVSPDINNLNNNNKTSQQNIKIKNIKNPLFESTLSASAEETNPSLDYDGDNICIMNISFPNNYGHCLHDVIPQLLYLDKHSEYDKIYTSGTPILHSLLEMIQIKFEKICFVEDEEEKLIIGRNIEMQKWPAYHKRNVNKTRLIKQAIDEFIKNNIKTEVNNRLIYCTRNTSSDAKHGRMMNHENEKEIVELLKKYCDENHLLFTMFNGQEDGETMSHIKQLKLFNEAKIVVGPHGSAMANVIYLNPKNKPRVCEFTSGTEVQVHGNVFDKHYNFLFGYLFEKIYDYNLIPFSKNSTDQVTSIDVDNLKKFIKKG